MVEVQKGFLILAVPARPSSGIGVAEVQKLIFVFRFCGARMNPLRGWCVSTRSGCGAVRIRFCLGGPSAEIACRSALAVRFNYSRNCLWKWSARLLLQSRGRGFDSPLVRGISGSIKEALLCGMYRPENRNLHSSAQAEHLARRYKRRASCGEKLAQSNVHRTA